MYKDFIKEKIGYYKALVTLIWTSTFVVGSGISWALLNLQALKVVYVSYGITFELALVVGFVFLDGRIRKLLKELKYE